MDVGLTVEMRTLCLERAQALTVLELRSQPLSKSGKTGLDFDTLGISQT